MTFKALNKKKIKVNKEIEKWELEKDILSKEQKIKEEKKSLFKNKISTSKILILFLFLNCSIIELFTGWVTIKSLFLAETQGLPPDFTPLITLIGAVVGEAIGYGVYSLKSMKENCEGGITYQNMLNNYNKNEAEG